MHKSQSATDHHPLVQIELPVACAVGVYELGSGQKPQNHKAKTLRAVRSTYFLMSQETEYVIF